MRTALVTAIEAGIKHLVKHNVRPEEYEEFLLHIRKTKLVRVGQDHKTVYEVIVDQATDIADWATGNRYSEFSDAVEAKKNQAVANIAAIAVKAVRR